MLVGRQSDFEFFFSCLLAGRGTSSTRSLDAAQDAGDEDPANLSNSGMDSACVHGGGNLARKVWNRSREKSYFMAFCSAERLWIFNLAPPISYPYTQDVVFLRFWRLRRRLTVGPAPNRGNLGRVPGSRNGPRIKSGAILDLALFWIPSLTSLI